MLKKTYHAPHAELLILRPEDVLSTSGFGYPNSVETDENGDHYTKRY